MIVGAGQVVQRPGEGEARDPIALAVDALRAAARDSGAGDALLCRADSVRHVATVCWQYRDEAALIAQALDVTPRENVRTTLFGGESPLRLLGETAQEIADGALDVALISGAEAVASVLAARRTAETLPWTEQPEGVEPTRVVGSARVPSTDAELAVGLAAPIFNYALLETAVRARAGATPDAHLQAVGDLWSRFSAVAAANPYAWLPGARGADELIEPGPANRPVSAPYLKLLTANIQVDLASALIVCSAAAADDAGVPRDRWVFPWAVAHAHDEWFMSERAELALSPAIRAMGRAALEHCALTIDDVEHVDLYSCFPSAVQISAAELGLRTDDQQRPLTVTGGLTFAGGPGNNYCGHALATLTTRLREDPEAVGMSTGVGWYMSKHACGVYSAKPPPQPFRNIDANAAVESPQPRRATADHKGDATVEAYTVPFGADGVPEAVIVTALNPDGSRALVRTSEPQTITEFLDSDQLGAQLDENP